jgi:RNA polymerase sigma-70 factor (ECF subfamily)
MEGTMAAEDRIQILVDQARQGDRAAFDDLVHGYRDRLKSMIHSRLGVHLRQTLDAEDILQESFLWAFRSLPRFQWRGENSFYRWLCSIAEHVILKAANRRERDHKLPLACEPPGDEVSPSKVMRRNERFDRLQGSFDDLSSDYREVIMLARVEGLRIAEIARRMNRSQEAVKKLLRRGLKKLREGFGETDSLHLPDRSLKCGETDDDGR